MPVLPKLLGHTVFFATIFIAKITIHFRFYCLLSSNQTKNVLLLTKFVKIFIDAK